MPRIFGDRSPEEFERLRGDIAAFRNAYIACGLCHLRLTAAIFGFGRLVGSW